MRCRKCAVDSSILFVLLKFVKSYEEILQRKCAIGNALYSALQNWCHPLHAFPPFKSPTEQGLPGGAGSYCTICLEEQRDEKASLPRSRTLTFRSHVTSEESSRSFRFCPAPSICVSILSFLLSRSPIPALRSPDCHFAQLF